MEFSISSLLASLGHLFWSCLNYHQPVSVHYLPNRFCSTTSLIDLWFLKIPRVDIWNSNLKKIHLYSKIALLKQRKKSWKLSHLQCCWLGGCQAFSQNFSLDFQMQMCKKISSGNACLLLPRFLNKVESLFVNFFLFQKVTCCNFASGASKVSILAKDENYYKIQQTIYKIKINLELS